MQMNCQYRLTVYALLYATKCIGGNLIFYLSLAWIIIAMMFDCLPSKRHAVRIKSLHLFDVAFMRLVYLHTFYSVLSTVCSKTGTVMNWLSKI